MQEREIAFKGLIDNCFAFWDIVALARVLYKWALSDIKEYPVHRLNSLYGHLISEYERIENEKDE